jgi:hypothetical protein
MPELSAPRWLEALPVVTAGLAVVLYGPSLGLSSTFGIVGVAAAAYAFRRGARAWVAALGIVLNLPLAAIGAYVLVGVAVD